MKLLRLGLSTLAATGATVLFTSLRIPVLSVVDWFLLAVAYQAASGHFVASTLGGAIGGLVQDVLLHPLKGANAFAKALLGYVLTIVSVIGIPPTLIASMYGMNFKNMPELSWKWGYQWGLGLIALSIVMPIIWFRRRGWC